MQSDEVALRIHTLFGKARKKNLHDARRVTTYLASYLCLSCIGVAVCKFIFPLRLEPELEHLPVIAFTAAVHDEDRAATRLAGFQSTSDNAAELLQPCRADSLTPNSNPSSTVSDNLF